MAAADGLSFYLGTHMEGWLAEVDVPLFVSHRRLKRRRRLPRARTLWALDSGGFSELSLFGEWRTTEAEYMAAVRRYAEEVGSLAWAAPMDWMCEPQMLERTGLTVRNHQVRTVENFLRLEGPFIPVLQGWEPDDYLRCWELYEAAGVHLEDEPLVGVGSVCRRQDTAAARRVFEVLPLRTHGFGVKTSGFADYGHLLSSADSMAWSYRARRSEPLPGCSHKSCSNCLRFALQWRERILGRGVQLSLAA